MNLTFLTSQSTLVEDYKNWYSRLRFYSDTIVSLARKIGANNINLLHYYSSATDNGTYKSDDFSEKMMKDEYSKDPSRFKEVNYLEKSAESYGINLTIKSISDYLSEFNEDEQDEGLVVFGIQNGYPNNMKKLLFDYQKVIKKSSLGYLYLSSDAELSDHQYVEPGRIGFLSMFPDLPDVFRTKLKAVVITEITDPDILKSYEAHGIIRDKVIYCPMIIDMNTRAQLNSHPRMLPPNQGNGRLMMLRNFRLWKEYPELLEAFRGKIDIYDSSMPAIRKKLIDTVNEYGDTYKFARYWSIEKMNSILKDYSFFLGMSTPTSDRFTYKIIESTLAGTVCLLPKISLQSLGLDHSISQEILNYYRDVTRIDVSSDESFRRSLSSLSDLTELSKEDYAKLIIRQKLFINDYFDSESSNVENRLSKIMEVI